MSMKDDEYEGYKIPGGSMIIGNIWAMSQDESLYSKPEEFHPERFLDRKDTTSQDITNPKNLIFGFGRRVCPGAEFADNSIFLLTSNIIATMNIGKAKNARGDEITPPADFTSGFVSRPKPFKYAMTLRSQQASDLIAQIDAAN